MAGGWGGAYTMQMYLRSNLYAGIMYFPVELCGFTHNVCRDFTNSLEEWKHVAGLS